MMGMHVVRAVLVPAGLALLCTACVSSEAGRHEQGSSLQPQPSHRLAAEIRPARTPSDTVSRQADLQLHAYLQCALKSARKLAVSADSAEQVAHTAMASCSPERQAFILAVARASDPTFASRHWEVTQPDIRRIVAKHVTEQRQFMTSPGRVSRGSNAPEHRPA
jgi:hypothetical protein